MSFHLWIAYFEFLIILGEKRCYWEK